VTIGALDYPIATVNHKLCLLVATDISSIVNRFLLGRENAGSALRSTSHDCPAITAIGNDMMTFASHLKNFLWQANEGIS
jgi:hypothetical protein